MLFPVPAGRFRLVPSSHKTNRADLFTRPIIRDRGPGQAVSSLPAALVVPPVILLVVLEIVAGQFIAEACDLGQEHDPTAEVAHRQGRDHGHQRNQSLTGSWIDARELVTMEALCRANPV